MQAQCKLSLVNLGFQDQGAMKSRLGGPGLSWEREDVSVLVAGVFGAPTLPVAAWRVAGTRRKWASQSKSVRRCVFLRNFLFFRAVVHLPATAELKPSSPSHTWFGSTVTTHSQPQNAVRRFAFPALPPTVCN